MEVNGGVCSSHMLCYACHNQAESETVSSKRKRQRTKALYLSPWEGYFIEHRHSWQCIAHSKPLAVAHKRKPRLLEACWDHHPGKRWHISPVQKKRTSASAGIASDCRAAHPFSCQHRTNTFSCQWVEMRRGLLKYSNFLELQER